jgi:hypothetical protein
LSVNAFGGGALLPEPVVSVGARDTVELALAGGLLSSAVLGPEA